MRPPWLPSCPSLLPLCAGFPSRHCCCSVAFAPRRSYPGFPAAPGMQPCPTAGLHACNVGMPAPPLTRQCAARRPPHRHLLSLLPPPANTHAHLGHGLLAAAAAHAHAIDNVALLGLEAHAAGLVGAAGAREPHNARQLPVLPAPHTEEEAEHIALLLLPKLLDVLVSTCGWAGTRGVRAVSSGTRRLPLAVAGRAAGRRWALAAPFQQLCPVRWPGPCCSRRPRPPPGGGHASRRDGLLAPLPRARGAMHDPPGGPRGAQGRMAAMLGCCRPPPPAHAPAHPW